MSDLNRKFLATLWIAFNDLFIDGNLTSADPSGEYASVTCRIFFSSLAHEYKIRGEEGKEIALIDMTFKFLSLISGNRVETRMRNLEEERTIANIF